MNFVEFLRSPFLQNTSLDTSLHIFFLFILFLQSFSSLFFISLIWVWKLVTAWKVSRYRVFSGPYFTVFGLNTERYCMSISVLCMSMYKKCSFFRKFGVLCFLGWEMFVFLKIWRGLLSWNNRYEIRPTKSLVDSNIPSVFE